MQRSKCILYLKRIGKAVLFLLIFALINGAFSLALQYQEGESESMLTRYSKREGIETIVLGNSVAKMLDEETFIEATGENTLNMCTPDQPYAVSDRLAHMASSQNPVKSVLLLTTFDAGINENRHLIEKIYDRTENAGRPLSKRIMHNVTNHFSESISGDNFKTEESLNVWIPWVGESVSSWKEVSENVTKRTRRLVQNNRLGSEYEKDLDAIVYERVDAGMNDAEKAMFAADMEAMKALPLPADLLCAESFENLAKLCSYCSANDIELTVMITPHRTDYFDRFEGYRDYFDTMDGFWRDFVSERGFLYYNFEEDDSIHEKLPDSCFTDWEHIDSKKDKKIVTALIAEHYQAK